MSADFKWRPSRGRAILWVVRWYCRYGISYRELEKRLRFHWRRPFWSGSWQVDETYIKVKGKWIYLCRAATKQGDKAGARVQVSQNSLRHDQGF